MAVLADSLDEANETVTLTISSASNATISDATATLTITDDDATPSLSIADVSGNETAGNRQFTVTLSAASGLAVTVNYATSDGTATAGADYTASNGTLTIAAGATTATFNVGVLADSIDEANETATLTLSSASNATISDATATLTITNDDPPSVDFNATSSNGSESISSKALTVDLSAASGLDVTVNYAITGTATGSGTDFTLANGTLTISAGDTSGTITIASIINDTLDENNETVIVTLSSPGNASLGSDDAHTYTINDNDDSSIPSLSIADVSGNETAGNRQFTVTLSAVTGQDVTVNYATSDGTATAGADYTAISATQLTIAAGATTATFNVGVLADTLDEANETVTLTLSSASNATISDATATLTITDDDATPSVDFNATSSNGAESASSKALTVDLSAAAGRDVTVNYAITGTATGSGTDFTLANGTLTISAGDTSGTITIASIINDTLDEANETVIVTLSSPGNATLGSDKTHTYTINDNDATPSLSINDVSGNETAGNREFTVTLSAASG